MDCCSSLVYFGEDLSGPNTDTNIIEISLNSLKEDTGLATGDPLFCSNCNCLLNSFSCVIRTDQNFQWKCEFCSTDNTIQAEQEELPSAPELTYLLQSSGQVAENRQGTDDTSTLIFCIDISGSMCISSLISGNLNFKTNRQQELLKLLQEGDDNSVDSKNTYVSRIECVQAAIECQLKELQLATPSRKVGIVTFNREVRVIGDGRTEETLMGDKLKSPDALRNSIQGRHSEFFQMNIGDNANTLIQKVLSLQEDGPTALGPGLFVSTLLAAEGGAGSKVVLCTDGLANIGIGDLESDQDSAENFYTELGNFAASKGVALSVISLEGEECRLESLAPLTEQTGGFILKVAPERLTEEFSNVLAANVIATNVSVTITLHKALEFRHEDPNDLLWSNSRLVKKVGNATEDSSFSFEFCRKNVEQLHREGVDIEALTEVHVQALFEYYSLTGMKCLRSITKVQSITGNAAQAKQNAQAGMIARNFNMQTNRMVQKGQFKAAQQNIKRWNADLKDLVEDEELVNEFDDYVEDLEQDIQCQMLEEAKVGVEINEDEEGSIVQRKRLYKDKISHNARKKIKSKKET